LFLATLLLLLFLERRPLAMLAVTIAGAFCWPAFPITGGALIALLPALPVRGHRLAALAHDAPTPRPGRGAILIGGALAALCVLAQVPAVRLLCVAGGIDGLDTHLPARLQLAAPCVLVQRGLTAIPALLLMLLALYGLAAPLVPAFIRAGMPKIDARRLIMLALGIAAIVIPWMLVRVFANPAIPNPNGVLLMAKLILLPAEGKILLPVLSAIVFWGPMLLLLMVASGRAASEARGLGLGAVAVIIITLGLGLVGEPRFLTTGWPLLVVVGALAFEDVRLPRAFAIAFISATLLLAQFWLPINIIRWSGGDFDAIQSFPKQLYFMHYGLWMAWPGYVGQLIVVAVLGVWLRRALRPTRKQSRVSVAVASS
jgi:hypothetical protein